MQLREKLYLRSAQNRIGDPLFRSLHGIRQGKTLSLLSLRSQEGNDHQLPMTTELVRRYVINFDLNGVRNIFVRRI